MTLTNVSAKPPFRDNICDKLHCEIEECEEFCEDVAHHSLNSAVKTTFGFAVFAEYAVFPNRAKS